MNAFAATRLSAGAALALLICVSGHAHAQELCTDVPCASDGSNPACDTLAEIDARIDAAANGSVVCLKRGSSWSMSGTGITFSTGHPGASRVTVCASDATHCTPRVLDDNPRIIRTVNTGDAVSFTASADGYTLKNLDFYNSTGAGIQAFESLPEGLKDITIEGGVFDGWLRFADYSSFGGIVPDNIKLGICGNPTEFRNAYQQTGDVHIMYGACTNCSFSLYVHHWGTKEPNAGRTHELDFSTWDNGSESQNVTVECSHFVTDSVNVDGNGMMIKASFGSNMTVRDNVFEISKNEPELDPDCPGAVIFGGHTETAGRPFHWYGAEIYRNTFDMGNCNGVSSAIGQDINIYNNIFIHDWAPGDSYSYTAPVHITKTGCSDVPQICAEARNIAFYNNTIYSNENGSGTNSSGEALIAMGNSPVLGDVPPGPHTLYAELLSPSLVPLASSGASFQIPMATDLDADGDGFGDAIDNCMYVVNSQSDSGGPGATGPDGVGNACQCGDLDSDGDADLSDMTKLRLSLADPVGKKLSTVARAHCSVIGAVGSCDVLDVVALARVNAGLPPKLTQSCEAAQSDIDGDGFADFVDNCVYVGNDQLDSGGPPATGPDGVGDACQCGDLNADGTVGSPDVTPLRQWLADPVGAALSSSAKKRCSVIGAAGSCDVVDVAVLMRASAGLPPAVGQTCLAAEPDLDHDGFGEATDNCPYTKNDQSDSGGVGPTGADGIGNACQCGDLDSDGDADLDDNAILRQALADPVGAALSPIAREHCSVVGVSGSCDVLDAAVLARANAGKPPGLAQACGAAQY